MEATVVKIEKKSANDYKRGKTDTNGQVRETR